MPDAAASKKILQIGNWPPPVCGWSMGLVGLREELEARGWDCQVMNLNENRRVRSPEYIDVQSGWDFFIKVLRRVWRGYAVHVRVNGESKKGYLLALAAMALARMFGRPALLTYCGGRQQTFFPAPAGSFRLRAFGFLFCLPHRVFCNSEAVKQVLLTAGMPSARVVPIPHFSSSYVQGDRVSVPDEVEQFYQQHRGIFFSYVCFRKEFALEFLAKAIGAFRAAHPDIGFMLVGVPERELGGIRALLRSERIEDAVCLCGSVAHEMFLTMLTRSLAYIRTPMTDGSCSSVLESLTLRIPVLAADNGTRPPGCELWKQGDLAGLLGKMEQVLSNRDAMVGRIPEIQLEDNARKMADSIEDVCLAAELRAGRTASA